MRSLLIILAVYGELRVISILYPLALILLIQVHVDTCLYEILIQFIYQIELTGEIHHRASFTFLVYHEQGRYACSTGHKGIVRTKGRGDVYDTRTVFGRYIITRDYTETFIAGSQTAVFGHIYRLYPRDELLVLHTYQVRSLVFTYNLERYQLVSRFIIL